MMVAWLPEALMWAGSTLLVGKSVFGLRGRMWYARHVAKRAIVQSILHEPERWEHSYNRMKNDNGLELEAYNDQGACIFEGRLRINGEVMPYWYGRSIMRVWDHKAELDCLRSAVKSLKPKPVTPLQITEATGE